MPLSQSSEHKKPDFVLEMPENGGSEGQKRTKPSILCSKSLKSRVLKAWAPTVCAEELPTLLEMAAAWPGLAGSCRLAGSWPGTGQGQMLRHRTKNRRG